MRKPFRRKSFRFFIIAAVLIFAGQVLAPWCGGNAQAAAHSCCQGSSVCHEAFAKASCCEYRSAPESNPIVIGTISTVQVLAPVALSRMEVSLLAPLPRTSLLDLSRGHSLAPPLYLAKVSFLC